METPIRKVSKHEAFDRFLNERVLGLVAFGMEDGDHCIYSHRANGGCAIGTLLPEAVAQQCDRASPTGAAIIAPKIMELCEPYLEDVKDPFWYALQNAHDNLAKALAYSGSRRPESTEYQSFVDHFIAATNMLEQKGKE